MPSVADTQTVLTVSRTWDGVPIDRSEVVWVALNRADGALHVDVRGTLQGDPPPEAPPGRLDRLWEYEVIEVFIAGKEDHYLEIEMGPHGHYLVLRFEGERNEVGRDYTAEYQVEQSGNRWRGHARISTDLLPKGPFRVNAYAIHGQGDKRRYLAAYPGDPGPDGKPDFHQLASFEQLVI